MKADSLLDQDLIKYKSKHMKKEYQTLYLDQDFIYNSFCIVFFLFYCLFIPRTIYDVNGHAENWHQKVEISKTFLSQNNCCQTQNLSLFHKDNN
jgi:hypothetical protein